VMRLNGNSFLLFEIFCGMDDDDGGSVIAARLDMLG